MLTDLIKYLQGQSNFGPVRADDSHTMAVPKDIDIRSLEQFSEFRYRERYSMRTSSIDAFIEYTNSRSELTPYEGITAVDSDNCEARTMFNARVEGDAGHCDDTALCVLKELPVYAMLQNIGENESQQVTQRELIDLIRDWNEYMPEAASLVDVFAKITVENVRNRSNTERDFGVEKSALEKIDVKAENAEIPSEITVNVVPYDGFNERVMLIGVSALVHRNDESVLLKLRVRSYENHKLEIAREFAGKLTDGLKTKPIIGTILPA